MKKVLILGASILQLPAIKKSKELGHYVICMDYDSSAIGFNYCDKYYVESTLDYDQVYKIAKQEQVDGLFTVASDRPLPIIAKVCRQLDLPGISEESASYVTNKYLMREQFNKFDVPCPKHFLVHTPEEIKQHLKNSNVPMVLKPINNSGSRGVNLLNPNDSDDLINKYIKDTFSNASDSNLIIEEYMVGPEYSVEGISINGEYQLITVTEKITTGPPYFVEMGHSQPALLDDKQVAEIEKVLNEAYKSLLIENSVSHAELIITDDGPKIVEVGSRLGGDNITSHLVPMSTGVNMTELVINQALGCDIKFNHSKNKASGIRYFNSHKGRISKIANVDEISEMSNIREVEISKNVGDDITDIVDSNSRIGYVIAEADNRDELEKVFNKVFDRLIIEIDS